MARERVHHRVVRVDDVGERLAVLDDVGDEVERLAGDGAVDERRASLYAGLFESWYGRDARVVVLVR